MKRGVLSGSLLLLVALAWARPAARGEQAPAPVVDSGDWPAAVAAPTANSLREKNFFYGSFGMRDPFRALVGGDFEPQAQELADLHMVKLVGMLWEDDEYIAIVQDVKGYGYALRPGDPVRNGVVVSVTRHELIGRLSVFGMVDRVSLRLQRVRDEE